jgi:hypothetical protein
MHIREGKSSEVVAGLAFPSGCELDPRQTQLSTTDILHQVFQRVGLVLANLLIRIVPIRSSIQPSPFLQMHSFLFALVSPCVMA